MNYLNVQVVQAINFIFKALGIKAVPYISQVGYDSRQNCLFVDLEHFLIDFFKYLPFWSCKPVALAGSGDLFALVFVQCLNIFIFFFLTYDLLDCLFFFCLSLDNRLSFGFNRVDP